MLNEIGQQQMGESEREASFYLFIFNFSSPLNVQLRDFICVISIVTNRTNKATE